MVLEQYGNTLAYRYINYKPRQTLMVSLSPEDDESDLSHHPLIPSHLPYSVVCSCLRDSVMRISGIDTVQYGMHMIDTTPEYFPDA